jgi:ribosomal protein L21
MTMVASLYVAIEGASVEAKVLQHLKGDKVIVFKKRRKGYKMVTDNILLKL